MDAEIFVPLTFFAFLTAVILGPVIVRERTRRSAHRLVAQALERGQQLDPQIVNDLAQSIDQPTARKSLGKAVILLALAGAFAGVASMGLDDGEANTGLMAAAIFIGAIGGAYALLTAVDYFTKKPA